MRLEGEHHRPHSSATSAGGVEAWGRAARGLFDRPRMAARCCEPAYRGRPARDAAREGQADSPPAQDEGGRYSIKMVAVVRGCRALPVAPGNVLLHVYVRLLPFANLPRPDTCSPQPGTTFQRGDRRRPRAGRTRIQRKRDERQQMQGRFAGPDEHHICDVPRRAADDARARVPDRHRLLIAPRMIMLRLSRLHERRLVCARCVSRTSWVHPWCRLPCRGSPGGHRCRRVERADRKTDARRA